MLVWLDGEPEQGASHAPFKISKDGEKLRLSERPASGFLLMDSISFGLQVTDVSLGRSTDGGAQWIAFTGPTPGYTNLSTGWEERPVDHLTLTLYPNPVSDGILHFSRRVSGAIYNVMGQKVRELVSESMEAGIYRAMWDGRNENGDTVSAGTYVSRLSAAGKVMTHKMMVVK